MSFRLLVMDGFFTCILFYKKPKEEAIIVSALTNGKSSIPKNYF
jgi:hypothetical protein